MDHLEAIVEIKNVVRQSVIDTLIKVADEKCLEKSLVKQGSNDVYDKDSRDVFGYQIRPNTDLFKLILSEIERLYIFYKGKFPFMQSVKLSQIDLLKYEEGGKFTTHIDHNTLLPRSLSIIINLNEDYEGGALVFTDQKKNIIKKLNLNKGSIVFFPSNFLYPHGIEPVTKGKRYSIVSWLQ
tara:strand:- start:116 stop:661 length:546 start_codon:yes stop_codon:yes gene_type:complete